MNTNSARSWASRLAAPLLLGLALPAGAALAQTSGQAAGGAPAPSSTIVPRTRIVELFDEDGSGMLDAQERARARQHLARQPRGRTFGGPRWGAYAPSSQGERIEPRDVESLAGVSLYDDSSIRTIFLELDVDDWEAEMEAFYGTDVELPARALVDGVEYRDVGVRFRGNSSYRMVPRGSKRPIRLKFDVVHEDQNLEGYRTHNLLNGINDPTFLRTVLYSRIANDYLPTPQVGFVRLVINGENWGIYQNQQQFNRDFVVDFFGAPGGVRWQVPGRPNARGGMEYWGDDPAVYRDHFDIDNRDRRQSWEDLIELFRVLNQTPLDELEAALEPILDIDGALRFLALDVALVNSDGYWSRGSDYYIYQDEDGRFHVLPHDINEALGAGGGFRGTNRRLDPLVGLSDRTKPLRSRLLAVPELRERYLEYVRDIAERWLDWEVIGPIAAQMHAMLAEDVRRDTRKLYGDDAFARGLEEDNNSLRNFVEQRREYLLAATDR